MYDRRRLIKAGLIIFVTLILLAGGWVSLLPHKVTADDLPLFEEPVLPPIPEEEYVPDQIIVRFKKGVLSAAGKALNESLQTSVIRTSYRGEFKILKIPPGKTVPEMVAIYSQQPIVENTQPNYIYHGTWAPNDPYYSYQWHFDQINMESAWDLDTTAPLYGGDPSIVVAVIDTGVAYETYDGFVVAPDLANTYFTTGYDFVNTDDHPNDDHQHGTHVCGTIAGSTNEGYGVAGIAFNTTIMPIKVLRPVWIFSDGSWYWEAIGTTADVVDGIEYAADNGADIINMSIGGSSPDTELENAVAYAHNAGVVIIASSGNDGDTVPQYPASYDEYVISVGATRYDGTRSYYSSYGSHLDIVAPGGDMTVDQNSDTYGDGVLQQTITTPTYPSTADPASFTWYFFQGTSMACPHVAGTAALILAKNPTWTPAQVRHALESTATDKGTSGWDQEYGWGLIDAYSAVNSSLPIWESYKGNYGDSGGAAEDYFDDYETEHRVYMYGTDFNPDSTYKVIYWDGAVKRMVDNGLTPSADGKLKSSWIFEPEQATAGDWQVTVYTQYANPSSYSAADPNIVADDTSYGGYAFHVTELAIPEFPTVLASISSLAMCSGIYLWMRRRLKNNA